MPITVPALHRASAILDALSDSPHGLSLAEVCERLKIPKSTAHNLCWTLVQVGQASRDERGTFRIGTAPLRYAHAFVQQTDLVREFTGALNADGQLPVAHWLLSVLESDQILFLATFGASDPFNPGFVPGMRLPALYAATGKAILATLPEDEIRRLHAGRPRAPLTRRSVDSVESFLVQRESIRERGYAICADEVREGTLYYAAPVFDGTRSCASAGVSISLPSTRPSVAEQRKAAAALLRVASALSRRLGAAINAGLGAEAAPPAVRPRAAVRARP
ncbi:IclR family transcriptional regulator [soil metagenome]